MVNSDSAGGATKPQRPPNQQDMLLRLQTSTSGTQKSCGSSLLDGTMLQRSRPASPVLTAAINLEDLALNDGRSSSGAFPQLEQKQEPRHHDNNILQQTNLFAGHCSSRPASRSASRTSSRESRPPSRSNHVPTPISRATTPLLYNSQAPSSSSFLFYSGDSYTPLLGGPSDALSPRTRQASRHARNPHNSNRRGSSSKRPSRLSPAYLVHRAQQLVRDTNASLAIGVPGEWRDLQTGKRKVPQHLKAYVPLVIWVVTSILFAVVVGVWHTQVFAGLDSLSTYLKSQGLLGDFILYLCILLTTFPPLPLYSTLITLSGYSFGLLEGFIISYTAALTGAVVVYLASKIWLKDGMDELLNKSQGLKRVVRAIERRPRLLWLIRLSPYPYNVMNVLLASSNTLSFSCYFWCTALSLPKLLVHCSVGTTIRSFAQSADIQNDSTSIGIGGNDDALAREQEGQRMKATAGLVGLLLCVGVFIYIFIVARRAVDDLDDSERLPSMASDAEGRSRSSKLYDDSGQYSMSHEEGSITAFYSRTSMSEYRPVSAGPGSLIRPTYHNNSSEGLLFDAVDIDSGDSRKKSRAIEGGRIAQRQKFERQDSTMPLGLQQPISSRPGPSYNNKSKHLYSEQRLEYSDSIELEGEEGNRDNGLLGLNIVDRLERVAHERSASLSRTRQ